MSKLLEFWDKALFPKNIKCIICGDELAITNKYSICARCFAKLPFISGNACHKCGAPLSDMGKVCIDCKNAGHSFVRNIAVFEYIEPIDTLIKNLKFHNKKYLADTLGGFIATKVIEYGKKFDMVIPIPLHEDRYKERGYNQSELLCSGLKNMGYNVRSDVLIKRLNTLPQVGLQKDNRRHNLEGAFKVVHRKEVKGKVILLVDDVYTTGTTMDECAHTLIKAGADKVYCITLSHA